MKEIQDMFYAFLWGLKLPHIESFCKALKMSWLYKLCVFYVDRNSKMTTTAGHSFYIGPIGSFYNDTGS
jgi:hypothetical protein